MVRFVGREEELRRLEDSYGKGGAVLIYGRRHMGKTTLVRRSYGDRCRLYLRCMNGSIRMNLEGIHSSIGGDGDGYGDVGEMVRDLGRVCTEGETVIFIDGYQYLRRGDPSIDLHIRNLIDGPLADSTSTLVLCGSDVSVMRDLDEGPDSPLRGCFSLVMHLGPLSFDGCRAFHPDMPDHELMTMYLTFGGVPRYHSGTAVTSFREHILRNIIPCPWVEDEVLFLMLFDTPDASGSDAVFWSVARGSVTPKAIQRSTDLGTGYVAMVRSLVGSGFLGTAHPMLDSPRRPLYRIDDALISFFYGVLRNNLTTLYAGALEDVCDRTLSGIEGHLQERFVMYCMDVVRREYPVKEMGCWWSEGPGRDVRESIDIVARVVVDGSEVILLADCTFGRKAELDRYLELARKAERFADRHSLCLMMISEGGFEDSLTGAEGVVLIGPEELYGHRPFPGMPAPE